MERKTAVERAVELLREAGEFDHADALESRESDRAKSEAHDRWMKRWHDDTWDLY